MKHPFGRKNWIILILFGLVGQLAWSVENMYFNLFVFETIAPNLDAVTLMVQLSGIVATVATLLAGTLSDKLGNRRGFISIGYIIWGFTVILFGFLKTDTIQAILKTDTATAISVTLGVVIAADCLMTLFGSTANDAAFNAWVTDNTRPAFRGKVEGVLSILPLLAMLIVAGGFGILVTLIGYQGLFISLGAVIVLCGVGGLFLIRDNEELVRSGRLRDVFYGFRPSVIKNNASLYLTLVIMGIYGIACQIFMPYLIIYMKTYLGFSVVEYSIVFGVAIIAGAAINLLLGNLIDRKSKITLLYPAVAILGLGLFGMYLARTADHTVTLLLFGIAGFVMISGYILVSALCGALVRNYTPARDAGKLQGIRMIFYVLIPMLAGPAIGNAINRAAAIPLPDLGSADTMTTQFIPAPEIFLAGALTCLLILLCIPLLSRVSRKQNVQDSEV